MSAASRIDSGNITDCGEFVSSLEELQLARQHGVPWSEQTAVAAAAGGYLESLQWLRSNGCPWNDHLCRVAANGNGCIRVLQWMRSVQRSRANTLRLVRYILYRRGYTANEFEK